MASCLRSHINRNIVESEMKFTLQKTGTGIYESSECQCFFLNNLPLLEKIQTRRKSLFLLTYDV
jgi:hypothetical protein